MSGPPNLASVRGIVIGASAGAVSALTVLLPSLPREFVPSIFIVVHVRRERPSLLADIFASRCLLPVREAEDKEPVKSGTIYFAPPDYHLLVESGPFIALSVDDAVHYCRPAIDVLFESASDVYAERLMGIILTGGNRDGAAGLAAVRRAGGVTVVQQPETAHVSLMPESAIDMGPVDFVLPLEQIAELLGSVSNGVAP